MTSHPLYLGRDSITCCPSPLVGRAGHPWPAAASLRSQPLPPRGFAALGRVGTASRHSCDFPILRSRVSAVRYLVQVFGTSYRFRTRPNPIPDCCDLRPEDVSRHPPPEAATCHPGALNSWPVELLNGFRSLNPGLSIFLNHYPTIQLINRRVFRFAACQPASSSPARPLAASASPYTQYSILDTLLLSPQLTKSLPFSGS